MVRYCHSLILHSPYSSLSLFSSAGEGRALWEGRSWLEPTSFARSGLRLSSSMFILTVLVFREILFYIKVVYLSLFERSKGHSWRSLHKFIRKMLFGEIKQKIVKSIINMAFFGTYFVRSFICLIISNVSQLLKWLNYCQCHKKINNWLYNHINKLINIKFHHKQFTSLTFQVKHRLWNGSISVHLLNAVLAKDILVFLLIANYLLHSLKTDTPFLSLTLPTYEFVDWPWNFSPTVGTAVVSSAPVDDAPQMKVVSALWEESGFWEETDAALCNLRVNLNLSDRPSAW